MYAKREPDPLNQYHNMRRKGAVPPLGSLGALYYAMSRKERARLLRHIHPADRALSDTILRVLQTALR